MANAKPKQKNHFAWNFELSSEFESIRKTIKIETQKRDFSKIKMKFRIRFGFDFMAQNGNGHVRVATVQTSNGHQQITKLSILPSSIVEYPLTSGIC